MAHIERTAAQSREEYMFMARVADQAERYDEMAQYMKEMVRQTSAMGEFSEEQRNMIGCGWKRTVDARRHSWRILSTPEQRDEKGCRGEHSALVRGYRERIEAEISEICGEIVSMLDSHLIPSASSSEAKVLLLKMKGDHHRYLAEFKVGVEREQAIESTVAAYKEAENIAFEYLAPTNPIRLGLELNFAVFYYEILNSPAEACRMADQASINAYEELDKVSEESGKCTTEILQMLQQNLDYWKPIAQYDYDKLGLAKSGQAKQVRTGWTGRVGSCFIFILKKKGDTQK